jgi:hypothetical protein
MEWNRGERPTQPAATPAGHPTTTTASAVRGKKKLFDNSKTLRYASIFLLFSITVIIIALVGKMIMGPTTEGKFVDKSKMQAVFLNGGQVYFGKISDLNGKYIRVNDIYYLRVNQQVQPNQSTTQSSNNDISLVKLGCELHGPQDSMLINREHVIFWENLKTDGQVAKAVDEYKKQNPDGQKCDTATGASTTPAATTPTTPTTNTNNR